RLHGQDPPCAADDRCAVPRRRGAPARHGPRPRRAPRRRRDRARAAPEGRRRRARRRRHRSRAAGAFRRGGAYRAQADVRVDLPTPRGATVTEAYFGVRPPTWLHDDDVAETSAAVEWAVEAERLGFDVVFVLDRLLAAARGSTGLAVYGSTMVDPYLMLSAIAARTTRVRLATLVAVVPFRHPAVMAKLTASLDVLSGGRYVFGAGSGWSDPELRMFGVDRRRRGAQMEEGIELVRQLGAGAAVTASGQWWQLDEVQVLPRPVQRPGPPVWLGSFAPDDAVTWSGRMSPAQHRALGRVGRLADGWVPLTYSAGHKRQLDPAQL